MLDFNKTLIEDLRAHGGQATAGVAGRSTRWDYEA